MAFDDSFFEAKTKTIDGHKFFSGESILIECEDHSYEFFKPFYYMKEGHNDFFQVYRLNQDKACIEHEMIPIKEIVNISIFVERLGVKKDGASKGSGESKKKSKSKEKPANKDAEQHTDQ